MRKRPYIERAWCEAVAGNPLQRDVQDDGRIRCWGEIIVPGETTPRFLRVILLDDGETVHNTFLDRNFRKAGS